MSATRNDDAHSQKEQQEQQQQPLHTQGQSSYGNKKLRFITNSAPPSKRRRIGAACLTCRKRKTACSGERPHCDTCKQNKLECAGYSAEGAPAPPRRTDHDVRLKQATAPNGASRAEQKQRQQMPPPPQVEEESGNSLSHHTSSTSRSSIADASPNTATVGMSRIETPDSGGLGQDPLFSTNRNRMPYFRWLGPTAIMPGFKQMVVKVKRQDTDMGRSSTDGNGMLSPTFNTHNVNDGKVPSVYSNTPAAVESDVRTPLNLPFYDTNLSMPPSELITHLASTFFTHLGCNYPFLQRKRFLKDLEEKQVDAILVDAVCALAARFSTHSLLKQQAGDDSKPTPAEYGHAFAQRAKNALIDTFSCPSVAAAQAALLLAYNEFGESRDSGLWMYLGIAIRLAEDLGMHKLEGLRYAGRNGPTPRMVKMAAHGGSALVKQSARNRNSMVEESASAVPAEDELWAVEQERVDTFWAIFALDRYVSSGTGRRSTLRDKDIELSFPPLDGKDAKSGWPAPFPALIRIVHLYGRVADLLNGIKEPSDITAETPKRLASMETQVTSFYQGLSSKLHFDAVNFQHYVKAGEGTNFVLLHFWFHVLIILLHQPTLLKTFEGRMLQLFPNSQQLAMSSAKTIADILSYSQLIDAKASLGNPFTTQPIYIAACAFLKETADQTASSNAQSRANSPARKSISESNPSSNSTNGTPQSVKKASISSSSNGTAMGPSDPKSMQRHTLLATAASQHYQLCHKALESLNTYWAGTKYILTVLEQKFQGVADPLLYTMEEGESAMEQPKPEPAFTSPGWRRKLSWERYLQSTNQAIQSPFLQGKGLHQMPGSPAGDPSKAIGWTLTGTMNSPSTNLAWHFASRDNDTDTQNPKRYAPLHAPEFHEATRPDKHIRAGSTTSQPASDQMMPPQIPTYQNSSTGVSPSDASLLLGLGSPGFQTNHQQGHDQMLPFHTQPMQQQMDHHSYAPSPNFFSNYTGFPQINAQNFGDMMIESQDVDMSMLGLDMMPWFDSYPPPSGDMMNMFDPGGPNDGSGHSQNQQRRQG